MVVGPTKCGKSSLILELIERAMETITPPPERFIWCYDKFTLETSDISKEIELVEGLPDVNTLLDCPKCTLIVIKDLLTKFY